MRTSTHQPNKTAAILGISFSSSAEASLIWDVLREADANSILMSEV